MLERGLHAKVLLILLMLVFKERVVEKNDMPFQVRAIDLWDECLPLIRKHYGDPDKVRAELPGVAERLGLTPSQMVVNALAGMLGQLVVEQRLCPVCTNSVFTAEATPVGDVVAGAEELLKNAAADDSEKIARSRDITETLREHDDLGGQQ